MNRLIVFFPAMVADGMALQWGAALACFDSSMKRLRTCFGMLVLAIALSHIDAMAALPSGYQGKPFESGDWT
jgi:hypothetical protein